MVSEEAQNIINVLSRPSTSVDDGLLFLNQQEHLTIWFSTSFGREDQVITHLIASLELQNIKIFTLDTGRLFQETYGVWSSTLQRFPNIKIKTFYPDEEELSDFVTNNGINAFYENTDMRKRCCHIRKVEPLKRALLNTDVWITGLRGEQSNSRAHLPKAEWDQSFGLIKYNPFIDATSSEINDYIKKYNIPYNSLHDRGFVSIGCAPCTRAIREGESERAGRWWWESTEAKECGLHVKTIVHS